MYILKLFILLSISVAASFAQEINFSATADKTTATIGERITITAQLACDKKPSSISAPKLRSTADYDVSGPDQSQSSATSIEEINGKTTRNITTTYLYNFTLTPKRTGPISVPALQINVDGETYASDPFQIGVGKEEARTQTSDVKFSIALANKNLYVGEQSVLSLQIVVNPQASAQLTDEGLSDCVERLEKALGADFSATRLTKQIKGVRQVINGESRVLYKIEWAIFPIKPGMLAIQPVSLDYITVHHTQARSHSDFFDDFFGGGIFGGGEEQVARSVVSNGLGVHVTQLPPAPVDFSGAVGFFKLNASIDPRQVPSGEAATLFISINGNTRPGNIGEISLPQLTDCSVFAPEKDATIDTTANGITTQKTYKYLIVPRREGMIQVPQISWSYFDPAVKAYKTLTSPKLDLMVTPGKAEPAQQSKSLTQEEIKQVGQDIRFIKTGIKIKKQTDEPYKNPLFIFLYAVPFFMVFASLLYKIQSARYEKDATLALRQKAARRAMKKISSIERQASKLAVPDFLGKVSECLESFISQKFGFSATGKVLVDLKAELMEHGTGETLASDLVAFLESMETFRFGGATLDASSKTSMLQKAAGFIKDLQKVKKEKPS
jgi:hypothetical protein